MSIKISDIKTGAKCKVIIKGMEYIVTKVDFNHFKYVRDDGRIIYYFPFEVDIIEVVEEP